MEEQAGKKKGKWSNLYQCSTVKKARISGTAYVNWENKEIPAKKQGALYR